ncbi:MAG: transglycosylase domain-containing protein [Acidimicrobiales bacterium]
MAGYDRPRGPQWPASGHPDEFDDLGPPRHGGHFPAEQPRPGAFPGDYGAREADDWVDDEDDFAADEWEPEPAGVGRGGRDGGRAGRKGGHRRGNILWRWRRGLFVAALVVMAMVAAGVSAIAQVELPDPRAMELSSYICTAEVVAGECNSNTSLAQLSGEGAREYIQLDDVPPVLIDAVIAAEDRSFFEHDGIDPVGIGRALYHDLRGGAFGQGGSTITQQFVKNTYLESERTVTRKLREAILAIKVEQEMSKEEILEGYLNTIYWGRNALGLQAASQAYFNMDVTDPNFGPAQASYLASLIRAPSLADANDPEHPDQVEEATRRRTTVLNAMVEEGYLDQAEQDVVEAIPVNTYVQPREAYRTITSTWGVAGLPNNELDYGVDYINRYVQRRAENVLMDLHGYEREEANQELTTGGYRIYTTIDRTMQQQAYDAVYRAVLNDPANDPSAGLVAIDNQGWVRAMVGGRDFYADNNFAQNNFAVMGGGGRQVGSTFKAVALAVAAARGISFEETALPAPAELELDAIPETPCDPGTYHNYSSEDADTGTLNLFQAASESSNTAFVGLMYELGTRYGPEAVLEMAEQLGMAEDWDDGDLCIPTVLGAVESTPLEMAEVYSTLANRGVHREPTIITRIDRVSPGGEVANVWNWQPNEDRVLTEDQADLVTYALEGVVDHGTGTGADIGRPQAGKTGSTSDNKDAWFVGYVPQLTAAVWMGYPEANWPLIDEATGQQKVDANGEPLWQLPPMNGSGRPVRGLSSVTGGSLPAQIWSTFMSQATANLPADDFVEPTEEVRRAGEELGDAIDAGDQLPPETTVPPPPPDPGPDPTISIPDPPITIEPPDESTTTTDVTLFPPTSAPPPGGGGGRDDD